MYFSNSIFWWKWHEGRCRSFKILFQRCKKCMTFEKINFLNWLTFTTLGSFSIRLPSHLPMVVWQRHFYFTIPLHYTINISSLIFSWLPGVEMYSNVDISKLVCDLVTFVEWGRYTHINELLWVMLKSVRFSCRKLA